MNARWIDYVRQDLTGAQDQLAQRAGIAPATLSRWINGKVEPTPDQVIKYARGVSRSPVEALVMAGFLTPKEARATISDFTLADVDELALLGELQRRAQKR